MGTGGLGELEVRFRARRKERVGEVTRSCLGAPRPDLRAQASGPPVSPLDYVVARVAQEESLGSNGVFASDPQTRLKAQGKALRVKTLLAQMFDASPDGSIDPDSLMATWGSSLRSFDGPRLKVSEFVVDTLKACYRRAEIAVDREAQNPASELGALRQQLDAARR